MNRWGIQPHSMRARSVSAEIRVEHSALPVTYYPYDLVIGDDVMETIMIQRTSTNGIDQAFATCIHVDDKRLVNCRTVEVNQLMPLKYHWATCG
jgi:hypothetical protein